MIKNIRIEYEGVAGDELRDVISEMIDYNVKAALACNCKDVVVYTNFNGILIEVDKNTNINSAIEQYHNSYNRSCYENYLKNGMSEKVSTRAHNDCKEIIDAIKTVDWIMTCNNPIPYMEHILMCAKKGYLNKKHCLNYISIPTLLGKMVAMHEEHPNFMDELDSPSSLDKHRFMYQNVYRALNKYGCCPEEIVRDYEI